MILYICRFILRGESLSFFIGEFTNIIPGMAEAKAIVAGGKLVSNNLYNADKISNDMLTMAAIMEINDVVNKAMANYELNYMSNNDSVAAKCFISTAKFYIDINKYGCDAVIEFTNDVEYAHNVQKAFDKVKYIFPLVKPLTDINEIISKNYNAENVTELRNSVSEISKTINSDNYDFFNTYEVLP